MPTGSAKGKKRINYCRTERNRELLLDQTNGRAGKVRPPLRKAPKWPRSAWTGQGNQITRAGVHKLEALRLLKVNPRPEPCVLTTPEVSAPPSRRSPHHRPRRAEIPNRGARPGKPRRRWNPHPAPLSPSNVGFPGPLMDPLIYALPTFRRNNASVSRIPSS
jgi:hypothetical protein